MFIMSTQSRDAEARVLDLDEIEAVSGGQKKAVAVVVQKCTVTKNPDGSTFEQCKAISSKIL